MAASTSDDWKVVLPRRGKKSRSSNEFIVPKREKEVQLWAPTDLEADPQRESKLAHKMRICVEKLENSDFCHSFLSQMQTPEILARFLKVLGPEKKIQMVIYGIGSIESFEPPRLQLSLALLMKRKFDWIGEIQVFDPIISLTESKVLTSLGCSVLSVNEQGRRQALKPTLFFMPHCEVELYDNLLEANWVADQLNRFVVFGNSFRAYEEHASLCKRSSVAYSWRRILAVRSFTDEFGVSISSDDDSFRAFHGSSWHFFSPANEEQLHHACDGDYE